MKEFNLLPREYQRESPNRSRIVVSVILCLLIWPTGKYGFWKPMETRKEKMRQLASYEEIVEQLPGLEEDFERKQAEAEELRSRIGAFQEMEDASPQHWQSICDTLMDSLPAGASLQELTCDGTRFLISGNCSYDTVSTEYLRNLKNSGVFSDVRMEKILYGGDKAVSFQLCCMLDSQEPEVDMNESEAVAP